MCLPPAMTEAAPLAIVVAGGYTSSFRKLVGTW